MASRSGQQKAQAAARRQCRSTEVDTRSSTSPSAGRQLLARMQRRLDALERGDGSSAGRSASSAPAKTPLIEVSESDAQGDSESSQIRAQLAACEVAIQKAKGSKCDSLVQFAEAEAASLRRKLQTGKPVETQHAVAARRLKRVRGAQTALEAMVETRRQAVEGARRELEEAQADLAAKKLEVAALESEFQATAAAAVPLGEEALVAQLSLDPKYLQQEAAVRELVASPAFAAYQRCLSLQLA